MSNLREFTELETQITHWTLCRGTVATSEQFSMWGAQKKKERKGWITSPEGLKVKNKKKKKTKIKENFTAWSHKLSQNIREADQLQWMINDLTRESWSELCQVQWCVSSSVPPTSALISHQTLRCCGKLFLASTGSSENEELPSLPADDMIHSKCTQKQNWGSCLCRNKHYDKAVKESVFY